MTNVQCASIKTSFPARIYHTISPIAMRHPGLRYRHTIRYSRCSVTGKTVRKKSCTKVRKLLRPKRRMCFKIRLNREISSQNTTKTYRNQGIHSNNIPDENYHVHPLPHESACSLPSIIREKIFNKVIQVHDKVMEK